MSELRMSPDRVPSNYYGSSSSLSHQKASLPSGQSYVSAKSREKVEALAKLLDADTKEAIMAWAMGDMDKCRSALAKLAPEKRAAIEKILLPL